MNKENLKLHELLKYICSSGFEYKSSFSSQELTSAINPQISLSECNILCRRLIDDGIVLDCTSKDDIGTVCVLRIDKTRDYYNTGYYLKKGERKHAKKSYTKMAKILSGFVTVLAILAGVAEFSGYSVKDFLVKDQGTMLSGNNKSEEKREKKDSISSSTFNSKHPNSLESAKGEDLGSSESEISKLDKHIEKDTSRAKNPETIILEPFGRKSGEPIEIDEPGHFYVVIGSYYDREGAVDRLETVPNKYKEYAYILADTSTGFYRVGIGKYLSFDNAEKAIKEYVEPFGNELWVLKY